MAEVRIEGVVKSFGDHRALDGLDLTCPDGTYMCLLGPSGCGKSTLLRTIAGLEDAQAGEIRIGGERVDDLLPGDRNIGFAFQNYALYPHRDVRGNLTFPLEAPRHRSAYPPERVAARVADTASLLHITEFLDRPVDTLSGGQKQRVALGRALIREPQVLLLDEPIAHLDARLRHEMRTELKVLHRKLGTTTVHVTHDQLEALAIADIVAVMRQGRIEQIGSPQDIYERPATAFVAGFIGDPPMSLLSGELAVDGKTAEFLLAGARLSLGRPPWESGVPAGRKITIGVRPSKISITRAEASLKARLLAHEWILREQQLTLALADTRLQFRTSGDRRFHVGEELPITIDLAGAIAFDHETGRAISI
jgi:multiple sugar transport system ATP-binding protein